MKSFLLISSLLISAVFGSALNDWANFKTKYNKVYETKEEEARRFNIFKDNLDYANQLSARDTHATYGVTKFMDMSREEFRSTILMNVTQPEMSRVARSSAFAPQALPDSFDWSSKGAVTPVKNQGQCGSCWDFSATETIESVCFIAGYGLKTLSEQQILDCDHSDYGCNGGWPYNAYKYVIDAKGIETEAEYPYTAQDGSCRFNPSKVACSVKTWKYVVQNKNEQTMQNFLYNNSPMSVCVDASSWQFYSGGVLTPSSGCGNNIDHCVQITGWSKMNGVNAWHVRNSWASDWGVNGYIYIQIGGNVCSIAEVVTVPCVDSKTGGHLVC